MQTGRIRKFVAVCLLGVFATLNTGCIDAISRAFVNGFGFSLGSVPAQILADYIQGFLNPDDAAE